MGFCVCIIDCSRSLEIEKENWPSSGFEFAQEVFKVMEVKMDSQFEMSFISCKQHSVIVSYMKQLAVIINVLRDLKQLIIKHKIFISFADFAQVMN